jgi:predicted cupin superfamily sugar epimerase
VDAPLDPDTIIAILDMRPHPEGGHYTETWRADAAPGERPSGTAIHFLLRAGERSEWHRVDAAEAWHFYAGAPLELSIARGDGRTAATRYRLGIDLAGGERPQIVVPAGDWQTAQSLGGWTLVGCTVSPGFRFEGFELAAPGWEPGLDGPYGGGSSG